MTPERAREWACEHLWPVLKDELARGGFVAGFDTFGRLCVRAPAGPPRDHPPPVHCHDDYPRPGNPYGTGFGYYCAEHSKAIDIDDEYPLLIVRED